MPEPIFIRPRFQDKEPICFFSPHDLSLPVCGKVDGKLTRYHLDARNGMSEGKELFCKIPAKTVCFGYVCCYDEASKVIYAGAEWSETVHYSFFAMLFIGQHPQLVRIEDKSEFIFKVLDPETELLQDSTGKEVSLKQMVLWSTAQP